MRDNHRWRKALIFLAAASVLALVALVSAWRGKANPSFTSVSTEISAAGTGSREASAASTRIDADDSGKTQSKTDGQTDKAGQEQKRSETTGSEMVALIPVHVSGAVKTPGVYLIREGSYLAEALQMAGGATEDAAVNHVNLAAKLDANSMVYIPTKAEWEANGQQVIGISGGANAREHEGQANGKGANVPISLSKATLEELQTLPGIGLKTAEAIIAYRQANGPFQQIDDLMQVPGIKEGKLDKIRALIRP